MCPIAPILLQRLNRNRSPTGLESLPVREQLILVELRPRLNKTALSLRKRSRDQLHWMNRKNGGLTLKICMEVSDVMRHSRFREHADDYAKETAEFRHTSILLRSLQVFAVRHQPPFSNPWFQPFAT
jgi:hypothetical protein